MACLKGQDQPMSRLHDWEIIRIREQYAKGDVSQARLAFYYGVSNQLISKIVTGTNWKHLEGPITHMGSGMRSIKGVES